VLNTNICTAASSLIWVFMDLAYYKRPSVIGAIQGMITGLVAITPAAGVVAGWGAIVLAFGSGTIPWFTMNILAKKLGWFARVDDTLEVFHTHFVGSLVGGIGTGLFATAEGCAAFGITNNGGAIDGNGRQVWLQIVGALFVIGWNIVWTSLIMLFIKYVCRVPLRMSEEHMAIGDYAIHGEEPYTYAYYNRNLADITERRKTQPELGLKDVILGRAPGESASNLHKGDEKQSEIQPVEKNKGSDSSN